MSTVRDRLEEREDQWLVPSAAHARDAPRLRAESPSDLRTEFQRDRDRILHCKAFRRLKYKTQVFLSPAGDHYRTRLTHTLEVTQIARTIARALDLNEDLTEAIGLGHDLGHTPFGHAGERALARAFPGFRHNEQSLRVVDLLERDGRGLNLTAQTRNGILCHSKPVGHITGEAAGHPTTFEGQIVKLADGIAYINHDLDDALRGGMLTATDVPEEVYAVLGMTHGARIDTLVRDAVVSNRNAVMTGSGELDSLSLSPIVLSATNTLRDFLFEQVYAPINALSSTRQAEAIVVELFQHYVRHKDKLPENIPELAGESPERRVADVISGMTDRFAIADYARIFAGSVKEH